MTKLDTAADYLRRILEGIVTVPAAVTVTPIEADRGAHTLKIDCAEVDRGFIVGRGGKMFGSLVVVMAAYAGRNRVPLHLESFPPRTGAITEEVSSRDERVEVAR